jgi:hypothetical protein
MPSNDFTGGLFAADAAPARSEQSVQDDYDERLRRFVARAENEKENTHISAHIPEFLGRYLDTYAYRTGIPKKYIVAAAICSFAALYQLPPAPPEEDF